MTCLLTALDHVQLAMPVGEEAAARHFYGDLLGLEEVAKPEMLAKRGGVWFQGPGIAVHLGGEADFKPAQKAHPCFRAADLDALQRIFKDAGIATVPDDAIPGVKRFYAADPFGNRIEFMQERR